MINPIDHKTGERIKTPRGLFFVVSLTIAEMKEANYYYHHSSNDGKYHIMGNGNLAFAVKIN